MVRTTDKLRHHISRGKSGDKVDWPDPAAAPLGTDDEAAGRPPQPAEIALAHETEITESPVTSEARGDNGVIIFVSIVSALIAGVILGVWMF